jgi:hypothetical protein
MGVTDEAGKAFSGFVNVMGGQPLALALVIMNFVLLGYLFYTATSLTTSRKETVDLIVGWQKETDKLMVNCVSAEVSRSMMDNMQKITETMLSAEQKEITRMQEQINNERNRSWELRQREQKELDDLKQRDKEQAPPRAQRLSSDVPFIPLPPQDLPTVLLNLPPQP